MNTNSRTRSITFATGSLQGFSFSLLPSLAVLFTSASSHISSAMYGSLFIPQTFLAVLGALGAPVIARRFRPVVALRLGILANIIALCALFIATSNPSVTYALLLLDTATLGLGFGLCNASANAMVELASTNHDRAITILNTLTGLGTSLSPAIIAGLRAHPLHVFSLAYWQPWPLVLAVSFACVFVATLSIGKAATAPSKKPQAALPPLLWIFAAAAICYGTCEGSFSSWGYRLRRAAPCKRRSCRVRINRILALVNRRKNRRGCISSPTTRATEYSVSSYFGGSHVCRPAVRAR